MSLSPKEQLEQIRRGAVEIISEPELLKKLEQNRPLVIKAGFDPTAPDLHLGHTVLLRKLADFLSQGHTVIFLIGDATALVGDPSGQSRMRKLMTKEEISQNADTYHLQVKKVLKACQLSQQSIDDLKRLRNSEWFGEGEKPKRPFGLKELVELTSKYTVARLIERDDFQKRLKAGQEVSMLELFYPLMQGYDSVMIAKEYGHCDVELGGTDQKFNLLVGRDLQRSYGQEPQVVLTMPLLKGTDGVAKMSKSLGNHIGINDPPDQMLGKVMSIPDTLIIKYFTLLTDEPSDRLQQLERELSSKTRNPRDAKLDLAEKLVELYHPGQGKTAKDGFIRQFSQRQAPDEMAEVAIQPESDGEVSLVSTLVSAGIAKTNNEARRLIQQGAVKLNGTVVKHPSLPAGQVNGVLQVGSRHYRKLVVNTHEADHY